MANLYKSYLGDIPLSNKLGSNSISIPFFEPVEVDYVLVAGGGGGGAGGAGGGGGEVQTNFFGSEPLTLDTANQYTIIVGEGGLLGAATLSSVTNNNYGTGSNGGDSMIISPATTMSLALGGGAGGGYYKTDQKFHNDGSDGGNGGGGMWEASSAGSGSGTGFGLEGGTFNPTSVNGYGDAPTIYQYSAGGGGGPVVYYEEIFEGAIVSGSDGYTYYDDLIPLWASKGGHGGEPLIIDWLPYSGSEAGAGGGAGEGSYNSVASIIRGNDGGGTTGGSGTGADRNGSNYTGAGGGGGDASGNTPYNVTDGGNGGSGIVVIRYSGTEAKFSGGDINISGSYVYHTFISSSTLIPV